MLNTLGFKSSVLFGKHTLLDKSLKALKLPIHQPHIDSSEILDSIH